MTCVCEFYLEIWLDVYNLVIILDVNQYIWKGGFDNIHIDWIIDFLVGAKRYLLKFIEYLSEILSFYFWDPIDIDSSRNFFILKTFRNIS